MSDNLGKDSTSRKDLPDPSMTGLGHKRRGSVQPSSSTVKKSKAEIDKDHREKNKAERIGMKAEIERLKENKFRLEGQADLLRKDLKDRIEEIIRSHVVQERQTNCITELQKKLLDLSDAQKKEREDHKKEIDDLKAKHEQEKLELESRIHSSERGQVMLGGNREMDGNIEVNGMNASGGYAQEMSAPNGVMSNNYNWTRPYAYAQYSQACQDMMVCVKCQSQHAFGECPMGTL